MTTSHSESREGRKYSCQPMAFRCGRKYSCQPMAFRCGRCREEVIEGRLMAGGRGAKCTTESRSSSTWRARIGRLLLLLPLVFELCWGAPTPRFGVNVGTDFMAVPIPTSTLKSLVRDSGFDKAKLFHARPPTIFEFANTGLKVMIAATNAEIPPLAQNASYALSWVSENLVPAIAAGVDVSWIAVGNEPFSPMYKGAYTNFTAQAITNMVQAVADAKLGGRVLVTTPTDTSVFVPGAQTFATKTCGLSLPSGWEINWRMTSQFKEVLDVLSKQGAPLVVNMYPYLDVLNYSPKNCQHNLDYALFRDAAPPATDPANGLNYTSLFDIMYDAVLTSLKKLGYSNISVWIGEIGWPTDGHLHATVPNAQEFLNGLAKRALSGVGTPLHRGEVINTFIFELTDENQKPVFEGLGGFERHWGLYTAQAVPKFAIDLSGGTMEPPLVLALPDSVKLLTSKWCVAKPTADLYVIEQGLKFACFDGGADCTPLFPNASCSEPNTTLAKASFAFNAYFQDKMQEEHACDFQGAGKIVTEDPSNGTCVYFIGLQIDETTSSPTPTDQMSSPSAPSSPTQDPSPSPSSSERRSQRTRIWQTLPCILVLLFVFASSA